MLENRSTADDERIEQLEVLLKQATDHSNEAEIKFDEVGAHAAHPTRNNPILFPSSQNSKFYSSEY